MEDMITGTIARMIVGVIIDVISTVRGGSALDGGGR